MHCISNFLEVMDHEMPEHTGLQISRSGYKVDGEGIKKHCRFLDLKSVDYFEINSKHGLVYVEFSDLFAQDIQIQAKIEVITCSDLPSPMKKELRKVFYTEINKELAQKFKDSQVIHTQMPTKLKNISTAFNEIAMYVVVVPPIEASKRTEQIKFIDALKNKLTCALPDTLFTSVIVVPLDKFLA